jgi:uncharacterized OB-fold protein
LGKLSWIAWLLFAFWWIPFSLEMSRRLLRLPRGIVRVEVIKDRHRRRSPALAGPKCPHCGERVSAEQAVCPNCYGDLKANCERCGKIIAAGAARGLCQECRRARQSVSP